MPACDLERAGKAAEFRGMSGAVQSMGGTQLHPSGAAKVRKGRGLGVFVLAYRRGRGLAAQYGV